jgi:hypothetical protein
VLRKTAIVLALPGLVTIAYIVCLRRAGELLSADRIAAMSLSTDRILWLTGYYDSGLQQKPDIARIIAPQVVVIGTSRVTQFRAAFFDKVPPAAFYNAGGCCQSVFDAKRTVDELISNGSNKPKVIILGVETQWFQARSPQTTSRRARLASVSRPLATWLANRVQQFSAFTDRVQLLQSAWRDPRFQAAASDRFAPVRDPLVATQLIGVSARATRSGFRNDGSVRAGDLIEGQETLSRDSVERSWNGTAFEQSMIADIARRGGLDGRYVIDDAVREFESILEETRVAGVQLIVIVPPIAPVAVAYLERSADEREYVTRFDAVVGAVCARYGVPFLEAYDGRLLDASNADFYDWLHPSERLMARLTMRLYADPRAGQILRPFGDSGHLAAEIAASGRRWQIYRD